jgi:hypothetical protein
MASRYRRDDQLASLATVSPQNRATMTTKRNPAEANSVNSAKLVAPVVARLTSAGAPALPEPPPWGAAPDEPVPELILKASAMITGRTRRTSTVSWVRRRRSCRTNSTGTRRVRSGRKPLSWTASSCISRSWTPRRVGAGWSDGWSAGWLSGFWALARGCGSVIVCTNHLDEDVLQ